MAKVANYDMPDDLYYTTDHAWVKIEGQQIRVGVTDFMQQLAGNITFVRVPRAGKDLEAGKTLCSMQSGKWAGKIMMPVSGKVVEANKDLASVPKPLNEDPYGKGWIAVIEPSNMAEVQTNLLFGDKALAFLQEEIAKHPQ
ncbi:glycine cleavage system protein H [Desulfosporosinus sp. FKB]|uniref:glycine cleavage system protein H n=1 Tax=Desulfosporosinus sp. FKB TaxID=1969835 RepID=UPI000B4A0426|nr:glycine cleavage system protein H [Desulfosporosinus sp. FKB]